MISKAGVLYPNGYGALWLAISFGCCGDTSVWKLVGSAPPFCDVPDKANHLKIMEITKDQTIAFTGNRTLTAPKGKLFFNLERTIRKKLSALLEECYNDGKTTFISGMAIGWDMLCAEEVLKLQSNHPEVRLIAAVPFTGQEAKYSPSDQRRYHKLLSQATSTITISEGGFSNQAYHDRNDFLIANSIKLIAYHNGKPRSGTASTIRKATDLGVEVLNLYDEI
ncbi:MAG: SLOG family protein [Rikenellaceae bacterium]